MVLADKQGQPITNAATGAQANVQLFPATLSDMLEYISIPGSQPNINWNNFGSPNAAAATPAAFGAQFNPYPHLFAAATSGTSSPIHAHLFMQLRAMAPFAVPTNSSTLGPSSMVPPPVGLSITMNQSSHSIKNDADILCQMGIRAGKFDLSLN